MFGIRTPVVKKTMAGEETLDAGKSHTIQAGPSVRRSIGEWEADRSKTAQPPKTPTPPKKAPKTSPPKLKSKAALSQEAKSNVRQQTGDSSPPNSQPTRYLNRTSEAKACLSKAKIQMESSRNLKKEIKDEITKAVERLYQLVKEAEAERGTGTELEDRQKEPTPNADVPTDLVKQLMENLQQHNKALEECQQHTRALSEQLKHAPSYVPGQGPTFAEVASSRQHIQRPLHSVVVSSVNEQDTGEEVVEKLRTAVDAKSEGTQVERLRKVRDQKVVVGFKTREEMTRVTERIKRAGNLVVEEIKNKDPLVIIRDVLSCHSDVEVIAALKRQNHHLIGDIPVDDVRVSVKYRRKTRNTHMCHIILQVSPSLWQKLTTAGRVHIDLQRVRVLDQSPLVQCTRCLRYGHSRKLCTESADLCIHCGDPHLRVDCPSRLTAETPKCHNCLLAKMARTDHNAFDSECPIRVKWDALARLSVAYC